LIQLCFQLEHIPDKWKQAHIYPIPKLIDWKCDITKTRPLMLLDTLRKAVIKIIINRLSSIMTKHSILKGNNFAGLSGRSTEILIKLMNMILKDAKAHKKLIWILLQDLSKAYNRVDLNILRKAMTHLKILLECINFIISFFIHHKNAILIISRLSEYYDVKIRIDQEEIISLLL